MRFLVALSGCALLVLSGCGYCDGAVRRMQPGAELSPDPVSISGKTTFSLIGDGPNLPGDRLLSLSGVGPQTWFLVQDGDGAGDGSHVPARIIGTAGGHSCRNGVSFELQPEQELSPGAYTLVLRLAAIKWPLVESKDMRDDHGERVIVRHYVVQ